MGDSECVENRPKLYATTLLEDGGRLFRVVNRNPCALDFHSFLYSLRTEASFSGIVTGAALVVLFVD